MVTVGARALTVKLETVTPLFLAGAEPRGAPELRPPAFRGALRYWLRAALGAVIGDQNLHELQQLESAVFGSTDQRSPIGVRLRGNPTANTHPILPHKDRGAGQRKAFDAGQSFDLIFTHDASRDVGSWRLACAAFNLAVAFGGVGLRSRRGYGTLRILASSDTQLVPPTPTDRASWTSYIERVIGQAIAAARTFAKAHRVEVTPLPIGPTTFPCGNQMGMIRISRMPSEPRTAMSAVQRLMTQVPKDPAFGGISPRVASPLWVRPIQMQDRHGLLLTVLPSVFPGYDYGKVRAFLDSIPGDDLTIAGWNANA